MENTTTDLCRAKFGNTGNFVGGISAARAMVIQEALSWQKTPFHDGAGVKGAGVDCAHFLQRVYVSVGLIEDFKIEPYSPTWFLHRDDPIFLNTVARYARRIDKPLPGDVLMFNFGRHAAHGAILVDDLTIIHAYKMTGFVTTDCLATYMSRFHSAWSVF